MEVKDQVFLLLGGNLGKLQQTFDWAIGEIAKFATVDQRSSLYASEAWGMMEQTPEFLNQVVAVRTDLGPEELLHKLLMLEKKAGSSPHRESSSGNYLSRGLDIDILLWGNQIHESDTLIVPHPRMHLRNFTLLPLAEIAPGQIHPVLERSISALAKESKDPLKVKKL